MITFRPLAETDFTMLEEWLAREHVQANGMLDSDHPSDAGEAALYLCHRPVT